MNCLTKLLNAVGSTPLSQYDYGYDVVNRRTYEQRNGSLGDAYSYDAIDQVTGVEYNASNVTTTPTSPTRTVGYSLDPVGNRTTVTDSVNGNTSYTANNLNQYTAVGSDSPTYDGDGNLHTTSGWTYTYDAKNRLTEATNGTTTMTLAYDGRNRCVSRTVSGIATYYYFDGWSMLEERNSSDSQLEKYVNGATVDEIINKVDGTGTVSYLYNALGNATSLTNTGGAIVENYAYDIYGAPTITDGSGNPLTDSAYNNRFLFTGREYLSSLGLYDYRNRFYSPSLGRFLQIDPIRNQIFDWLSRDSLPDAETSQGLNLYSYVQSDPLSLVDPLGLCCEPQRQAVANDTTALMKQAKEITTDQSALAKAAATYLSAVAANSIATLAAGRICASMIFTAGASSEACATAVAAQAATVFYMWTTGSAATGAQNTLKAAQQELQQLQQTYRSDVALYNQCMASHQ